MPFQRENVGTFDEGIKASCWSPDEELLAIVTGSNQLLSMTKSFEPLSELPLQTKDFGINAPVNLGWGEKSTQFHGSVGKEAAKAGGSVSTSSEITEEDLKLKEDDDGKVRISWRGDSAWFSVSSLEKIESDPEKRVRTIRIFSRVAELSSTAERTINLRGSLSWQPSGSIIASTQKFVGGERVVFFERNGLRRYDFELREGGRVSSRVRELSWNADSTILGVWVERSESDGGSVGELILTSTFRT